MRVAVPAFGDEVSPRFGCSRQIVLASVNANGVQRERVFETGSLRGADLAAELVRLGVRIVICGGIGRCYLDAFEQHAVTVYWGVIGSVDDALGALQAGTLQADQFLHQCGGHGPEPT